MACGTALFLCLRNMDQGLARAHEMAGSGFHIACCTAVLFAALASIELHEDRGQWQIPRPLTPKGKEARVEFVQGRNMQIDGINEVMPKGRGCLTSVVIRMGCAFVRLSGGLRTAAASRPACGWPPLPQRKSVTNGSGSCDRLQVCLWTVELAGRTRTDYSLRKSAARQHTSNCLLRNMLACAVLLC